MTRRRGSARGSRASVAFAFAALLAAACGDAVVPAAVGVPPATVARRAVLAASRTLRGTVLPEQRRAAMRRLRVDLAQLTPAILTVLESAGGGDVGGDRDGDRDGFVAAAALAAELRMSAALPLLLDVLDDADAPHRAAAFAAANRIRALPTAKALELAGTDDAPLRLAALDALAGRDDVPFDAVLPFLVDADAALAGAAARALPAPSGPEQLERLRTAEFGSDAAAAAVVTELGSRPFAPALVEHWLAQAGDASEPRVLAVLALVRDRRVPVVAEPLLRLLDGAAPAVRFEALRCLLLLRLVDAAWVLDRAGDEPPPHQLLCGLGLLHQGRPEGARLLHRLAFGDLVTFAEPPAAPGYESGSAGGDGGERSESGNESAPDAAPADVATPSDLTVCARQILSRIADLPLHGDASRFEAWCERPRIARPDTLALALASVPFLP